MRLFIPPLSPPPVAIERSQEPNRVGGSKTNLSPPEEDKNFPSSLTCAGPRREQITLLLPIPSMNRMPCHFRGGGPTLHSIIIVGPSRRDSRRSNRFRFHTRFRSRSHHGTAVVKRKGKKPKGNKQFGESALFPPSSSSVGRARAKNLQSQLPELPAKPQQGGKEEEEAEAELFNQV